MNDFQSARLEVPVTTAPCEVFPVDPEPRLGAQARIIARERQDPERVEAQLMSAYREAMTAVFTSEVTHAHF